jgi:hypothetical protein
MDSVRINISGERQAGLKFEEFPNELYDDLRNAIDELTNELFARVMAATPDKTGSLRNHERVRIFTDENRIKGYIDVTGTIADIKKAAALEYGAHKSTEVKSHSMKLDHFWDRALSSPVEVMVSAYSRVPDVTEVSFERGPLAEMHSEIIDRLNTVVKQAVEVANR